MPKYRLLTHDELMEFEKEFIEFLVVNGITAPDWEKMKKENSDEGVKIIGSFSDVIMEGTMRKIEFLESRSRNEVRTYQCLPEKIVLMALRADGDEVDFTTQEGMLQAMENPPQNLEVYTSEKKYTGVREHELFAMTQQGCLVCQGDLFKTLALALAESKG
ncbi:MAG: hypothetical protein KDC83_13765 [Flavobacteriales bacterium]|nr:hypothetical protein [Flavobacteriales bacterium]